MSTRRVLAGSVVALLMPASLLIATQTTSSGAGADVATTIAPPTGVTARRVKQRAKIYVHPQIADQGGRTRAARQAKTAVSAVVKPGRSGRPVVLQRKAGKRWKKVGQTRSSRSGAVEFTTPTGGKARTFRVVAKPYQGLRSVKSKGKSNQRWVTPAFSDEFSGDSYAANWTLRGTGYEPHSARACSRADGRAVKLGGGAAHLSVMKDPTRLVKCDAYSRHGTTKEHYRLNGHIGTQGKFDFRYGYAAARIKMHKEQGQHGGFWMQPAVSQGGTTDPSLTGAEIDVIEWFGKGSGGLASFIYYKAMRNGEIVDVRAAPKGGMFLNKQGSFLANRKDSWWGKYHVFSVEWTPKQYVFRIDGQETFRTRKGVSGQPQYLILSLLASDYELRTMPKGARLPQTMHVDWVRAWQL